MVEVHEAQLKSHPSLKKHILLTRILLGCDFDIMLTRILLFIGT